MILQPLHHARYGNLLINFYTRVLARPAAVRVVLLHTHALTAEKDPITALVSLVLMRAAAVDKYTLCASVRGLQAIL